MLWKRRKICAGTTDYAVTLNDSINGIYLSRSSLDAAFDDDGRQINPLLVRLTGNVPGLVTLFIRSDWQVQPEGDASLTYLHRLLARSAKPRDSAP